MSEKKTKKKTKRSKEKYPSLKRNYNSKVRQEYIDYDYIDELDDEAKQFLEDFNNEHYGASVGKQADEGKDNRFTKGKAAVKERQDANNQRQRDMYGRVRSKVGATKLLNYEDSKAIIEEHSQRNVYGNDYEDALIDYLDYANDLENSADDTDDDT